MIRGTIIFVTITVFLIFYILKRNNVIEGFSSLEKYLDELKLIVKKNENLRRGASNFDVSGLIVIFKKTVLVGDMMKKESYV